MIVWFFYGSVVCVFGFDLRWMIFEHRVLLCVSPTHTWHGVLRVFGSTWHGVLRVCPGFYVCVSGLL